MGLFFDLADIAKDIVMLPFEIGKAIVEGGADIAEATTQGIKNAASGEPEKEIRTSYDVKEDADKRIEESNRKYYGAKNDLGSAWYDMRQREEKVVEKRTEVYQLLGKKIHSKKLPALPDYMGSPQSCPNAPAIDSLGFDFGTALGLAGTKMRMEAAEEYLEKAKDYQVEIKGCVEVIRQMKRTISDVESAQKEELKLLDIIQKTYERQTEASLLQCADALRELAQLGIREVTDETARKYAAVLKKLNEQWY